METITFEEERIEASYLNFEKYVASVINSDDDVLVESLQLKKEHSKRVAKLCRLIAEKLLLDEEEQKLAEFIGLWHDIGRFEQFRKYRTFNDIESEDHAGLSIHMLENMELFSSSLSEGNRQIIIESIRHHNKIKLPENLDKQVALFSQILRDADKLDIWKICVDKLQRDGSFSVSFTGFGLSKNGKISKDVIKTIDQRKSALKEHIQSVDDFKLFLISMVFDLNFKFSFQLLNEQQLIRKIYESMPKKDEVYDAYREVKLYIENKFIT